MKARNIDLKPFSFVKYTNLNNMIICCKSNLRVGILHHSWPAKYGYCVFFIMFDLYSRTGNIVTLNSVEQCVLVLEMVLVAV